MKKTYLCPLIALILTLSNVIPGGVGGNKGLYAQAPQGINYQAVARDASGNPLKMKFLGVKFKILQGSSAGSPAYTETHNITTNEFGLFTAEIGKGAVASGTFNAISWSTGSFWLDVSIDTNNSNTFIPMGTMQFLSVPYALHSGSSGSSPAWGLTGNTASFGQYFGTNNSLDLIFKTNNLERIRIDSSTGNVGINHIVNPPYRLSIGGSGTDVTSPSITFDEWNVRSWAVGTGLTVSNKFSIRNRTLGFDAITIDSANNVGIGTTAPEGKLTVEGNTFIRSGGMLNFRPTDNSYDFNLKSIGIGGGARLAIGSASMSTEAISILAVTGNVGIGTATPASTLEVNGAFGTTIKTITASTTLDNTAGVWYVTAPGVTLTLPAASGVQNRRYIIVNRTSGSINISPPYIAIISGAVTTSPSPNTSIEIISDGSNWLQIK